jgi:hypothetical protein
MFTRARRLLLCWARWIQSTPSNPASFTSIVLSVVIIIIALEKLSLHSLRNRRHHVDALFFVHVYRGLKCCTSLLENVVLRVPASNLRDFSLFAVCPSARCPCAATAVQSEPFLSITFTLIKIKLLITFVHTPNVLCYVVLSYHVLVTTPHLRLFVYFL